MARGAVGFPHHASFTVTRQTFPHHPVKVHRLCVDTTLNYVAVPGLSTSRSGVDPHTNSMLVAGRSSTNSWLVIVSLSFQ